VEYILRCVAVFFLQSEDKTGDNVASADVDTAAQLHDVSFASSVTHGTMATLKTSKSQVRFISRVFSRI